jgi:thiamine biosynthesis lipoprotein ApbE
MKKNASILFFAILLFGILFHSCKNKNSTTAPTIGREYDREFLGMKYKINVVGDTNDYTLAFDSIENSIKMHVDGSNPESTVIQYNTSPGTNGYFEFVDRNKMMGILVSLSKDMYRKSNGYWDFTLSPAQLAWLPQILSSSPKTPNIDSLMEFTGMSFAIVDIEDVEENGGYKLSKIRKINPKVELDLQKIGSALVLDKIIEYLKIKSKNISQATVRTDVWHSGFGTTVDSLNVLDMTMAGQKTGNMLRVVNRSYATFDSRNKVTLLDPKTLFPVYNEMYQSYVSSKTLVESYVFAEAFMVMAVEGIGHFYEQNAESDIQSLVYFMKSDTERASASTENFNKMMVTPSAN